MAWMLSGAQERRYQNRKIAHTKSQCNMLSNRQHSRKLPTYIVPIYLIDDTPCRKGLAIDACAVCSGLRSENQ